MSETTVRGEHGIKAWAAVQRAQAFGYALVAIAVVAGAVTLLFARQRINADIELAKIAAGCKE